MNHLLKPLGLSCVIALWLATVVIASAETKHAAEQPTIKSENSDVKTLITFHNRSDTSIKLYWLDFAGNRVLYKTLESQQALAQITYLTHPWLVTDANDNAWHVYYPDAQPRTIEIGAPPIQ